MLQNTLSTRTEPISQQLFADLEVKIERRLTHHADILGLGPTTFTPSCCKSGQTAKFKYRIRPQNGTRFTVEESDGNHLVASAMNGIVLNLRDVTYRLGL